VRQRIRWATSCNYTFEIIMPRKTFTSLLLFLIVGCCCAQTFPLSDFVNTVAKKYGAGDLYDLYDSKKEFSVNNENGKLVITKTKHSDTVRFNLPKGKLVGTDYGEWGGSLMFVPNDTTEKEIRITNGNIRFIFECRGKIYCLEGLYHLSFHYGGMYQIDTLNGVFTYTKVLDFDYPPDAYAVYTDTILVASHGNLYRVLDLKKELIFNDSLFPNSMIAFDDRHVYMGVTGGYAKVDLTKQELIFYRYTK
jgi:hypothetical protein